MGYLINPYILEASAPASSLLDNILAYYRLDGDSDDSVASNDGVDSNITYNTASGIISSGASFNGSTSRVTLDDNWIPSLTSMTVSCWVNYDSIGTGSKTAVGNYYPGGTGRWFSINSNPSSQVEFAVDSGGDGGAARQTVGVGISAGTWYHVVGIRDTANAELRIHVNYDSSTATTSSVYDGVLACSATTAWLGQSNNANYMPGDVDEVGIWDRVLTLAEIEELYNAGSGIQYPF